MSFLQLTSVNLHVKDSCKHQSFGPWGLRITERIEREGKGCLIVINKWDTIPNKNQQTTTYYEQDVREKIRVLDWAPIVYSTAIAGHKFLNYLWINFSRENQYQSKCYLPKKLGSSHSN